jgi:hypothetical protein
MRHGLPDAPHLLKQRRLFMLGDLQNRQHP